MNPLTNETQLALEQALKKVKAKLLGYVGVKDVGIGYAMKDDKLTNEPAIIVLVAKKKDLNYINEQELIPKEIDGIRIDIIESNPVEDTDPYSRFEKVLGGISISSARLNGGGTLGGILYDRVTNEPMGLTNWHVAKRNRGKFGDYIVQPAWTGLNDNSIGTVADWNKNYDCVKIALTERAVEVYSKQNDIVGNIQGITRPLAGMAVQKSGARTGVTYGRIQSIFAASVVIVPNAGRTPPDTEISDSGDSGSLWITDDAQMLAVALHWGGDVNSYKAYANDLTIIADLFNLKI